MKNQLEEKILKQLQQTRHCNFKRTLVDNLFGKDWTIIYMPVFAKELAKELKGEK